MQNKLWTISELATELGMTARAIRFYEDKGLLNPQRVGLNRVYNYQDRARLKLALRGKRLGFSLDEIREFLDLYQLDMTKVTQMQFLLTRVQEKAAQLRRQQEDLAAMLHELESIEADCQQHLAQTPVTKA
ncbi:MAG: MerR family DNA-binding transcriptional regulator [Thiofilum sp.]|uniref:MerR family transcriptional regulator n=1 Tax=Thiofilum sp. TaxID=2212733 RepID=UPI0025DBF9ED|nr:MerR family DNA-binding transcriptional regulator [Thiofilum sp.]MBK8453685.1 MerR family DNA-binding transcriptional regulator [Thiofilum sp.]